MVWPTSIIPFQNRVEASTSYKPLIAYARNLFYSIITFYKRLNKSFVLHLRTILIWDWKNTCHFYKILHPRRCAIMCQNGAWSGLQHWVDSGPIAAQCGLSTWIWSSQYQIFLNMLTHNSHTCNLFVTRNWSIVQSDWPSGMHCLSPELAYLKHGNTKEIHFQEIVVSDNVLQF